MRRAGSLWSGITSFDALDAALRRAARGKRDVLEVARHLDAYEPRCLRLQERLEQGSWRPGPTREFVIHDPKRRTITIAPFEDRVVHHALIGRLEPIFERRMIPDSFACRRGKGLHRALDRVQAMARRSRYSLRLDVATFFASIEHDTVREVLARILKDHRVLELCDTILRGPSGTEHVGLPVGALTSQWFANMLLDRLDHFVKERLRVRYYARYMDDMVLFGTQKIELRQYHDAIDAFLRSTLRLELKPRATRLSPCSCGVPFLGVQLYPHFRRMRPANKRRARWRLRYRRWQFEHGALDADRYVDCMRSVYAHLAHAGTEALRRHWLAHEPADR